MLEDPWAECSPVQVTEVAKAQASSTRHRFRLFTRLEQDNDGMEDHDEPGQLSARIRLSAKKSTEDFFHQIKKFGLPFEGTFKKPILVY